MPTYPQAKCVHLVDVKHDISWKYVQWRIETKLDPSVPYWKHYSHPDSFPSSKMYKNTFRVKCEKKSNPDIYNSFHHF